MNNLIYKLQLARKSSECDIETIIIYVNSEKIGIHENINVEKFKDVLKSILQDGYKGPAISVMQTEDKKLPYGIIDGHNRLAIFKLLKILGILKIEKIPVQILPLKTEQIRTQTLDINKKPLKIEDIQKANINPNSKLTQSTTFFQARLSDGKWVRIRETQPDLLIAKDDLLDFSSLNISKINLNKEKINKIIPEVSIEELKNIFCDY